MRDKERPAYYTFVRRMIETIAEVGFWPTILHPDSRFALTVHGWEGRAGVPSDRYQAVDAVKLGWARVRALVKVPKAKAVVVVQCEQQSHKVITHVIIARSKDFQIRSFQAKGELRLKCLGGRLRTVNREGLRAFFQARRRQGYRPVDLDQERTRFLLSASTKCKKRRR